MTSAGMTYAVLRTPAERFINLQDFPYAERVTDDLPGFEGWRYAYVDEGSRDAAWTFLCLHGEPTWSYIYRRMIPALLQAGHRIVAPDHFGFGRSDKPVAPEAYSFDMHRRALIAFVRRLGARRICLVVQDWGGLLGLTLPMEFPGLITRLLVMNTALATGGSPGDGFYAWRRFVRENPDFDVGRFIKEDSPELSDAEVAAYNAPFPDPRFKEGVRRFPELVPTSPDAPGAAISRAALTFLREQWRGDSFMAIGMRDRIIPPVAMHALRAAIPGCPEPLLMPAAGHFVQEHGEGVIKAALDHFGRLDAGDDGTLAAKLVDV